MSSKNAWIKETERVLVSSPVIEFLEQDCRSSEDGRKHRFYVMRSRDWCNIIPITEDGKVVLVRQYRIGVARHTLEIPGGISDATDSDVQAAALREMTEETGYVPLPGARCVALGESLTNPAILDNHVHSFVVGPVRREKQQNLDSGEMIEVVEVPLERIPEMILKGEIEHALMLNTFFFLLLRSKTGAEALSRELGLFAAGASR